MAILDIRESSGVPWPFAAKAACYACSLAPKGPWILTSADISHEGSLVICGACAREFGASVGLVDPGKVLKLEALVGELVDQISELQPKADAYALFMRQLEEHTERQVNGRRDGAGGGSVGSVGNSGRKTNRKPSNGKSPVRASAKRPEDTR